MWFKFAKLFFVVNTSVQAPTSLIASNDPNVVNYDITKEMVKHVKYHDFDIEQQFHEILLILMLTNRI
ncbi:hypothetical protein [Spiroplasma endosymbiont of Dactylopius coccus]